MIVFAQVSDIHLDGSKRRGDRAAAVFAYLNGLSTPLAAVLLTGDIADHGTPAEYEEARALLATSRHPVFTCPGNHDVRAPYRKTLLGLDGDAPADQVHEAGGAVFALCDSTVPGGDDGYLSDETLGWLDAVLAERPDAPAFVCFHHPPVELHLPYVDAIRQFGEHRLAEVLGRHPQVVATLCGHAHTPAATTFAGLPLLVAPGVVSTLLLPWEQGDLLDEEAPAAVAFHVLGEDGRLVTHYRVVAG